MESSAKISRAAPLPEVMELESDKKRRDSTGSPFYDDYIGIEDDDRLRGQEVWSGHISFSDRKDCPADLRDLKVDAFPVSGYCDHLPHDIEIDLHVAGRIEQDSVIRYLEEMRNHDSKEVVIVRFHPKKGMDRIMDGRAYESNFNHLVEKRRFGVLKPHKNNVKDFYLIPVKGGEPIPRVLLPFLGPGLEEDRPDLLLGVLLRRKRPRTEEDTRKWLRPNRRNAPPPPLSPVNIHSTIEPSVPRPLRSFTPPLPGGAGETDHHHHHHQHHNISPPEVDVSRQGKLSDDDNASPYDPGESLSGESEDGGEKERGQVELDSSDGDSHDTALDHPKKKRKYSVSLKSLNDSC
jgi:hypothetical protein